MHQRKGNDDEPISRLLKMEPETPAKAKTGWVCVICSGLATLMMGGVVFGFSSLYPVLYKNHVFESACSHDRSCSSSDGCCSEQRLWLTLMASCSLFAADGVMVLYGELNDRFGPGTCLSVGGTLAVLGFDLLAAAAAFRYDGLWFAALCLLGVAGPGVFMGCLAFGQFMPDVENLITAGCAAMWDSSSVIFLIFELVSKRVSMAVIGMSWSVLCLIVFTVTLTLLKSHEKHVPRASKRDVKAYLSRRDFVLLVAFMAAYNLKSAFYIETISDQIRTMMSEHSAKSLDLTFDLAFPIGGLATSLFAAKILRWHHDVIFGYVFLSSAAFAIIQLAPNEPAQYVAALLFGPVRTLQWAVYFHFLVTRFPETVSGRLIGYGNLVIALVGDGIPYALVAFVNSAVFSDGTSYLLVHGILGAAILVAGTLILRHLRRERPTTPHAVLAAAPLLLEEEDDDDNNDDRDGRDVEDKKHSSSSDGEDGEEVV